MRTSGAGYERLVYKDPSTRGNKAKLKLIESEPAAEFAHLISV